MHELIYCSAANDSISTKDIESILNVSRKFNSDNSITGCLLYYNFEFVQILEGDEQTVKELFSKIENDTRHHFVKLLFEGNKEARAFPNWTMAYHELNKTDAKNVEDFLFTNNFIAFSSLEEKPSDAVRLFYYVSKQILETD